VKEILDQMDFMTLNCVFQVVNSCKSAAVALLLIHGHISVEQGVRASRIDEDFQTSLFGVVQGAHDLDEAFLYTQFATAKNIINLS
jgi:chaperone required for assembly of F1-ATPase